MTTRPPSHDHEEIARHAYELWQDRGCPENCAEEIWLEAAQQLNEGKAFAHRVAAETAAESLVEYNISPAVSEQEAIRAAVRRDHAPAPQVPRHPDPKDRPAGTGKPLRTGAHSR